MKKLSKKFLAVLLTLALVVAVATVAALADTIDGVKGLETALGASNVQVSGNTIILIRLGVPGQTVDKQ